MLIAFRFVAPGSGHDIILSSSAITPMVMMRPITNNSHSRFMFLSFLSLCLLLVVGWAYRPGGFSSSPRVGGWSQAAGESDRPEPRVIAALVASDDEARTPP